MTSATASFPRGLRPLLAIAALAAFVAVSCGDDAATTTTNAARDFGGVIVIATPRAEGPAPSSPPVATPVVATRTSSRDDLSAEARAVPTDVRVDPLDDRVLHVIYAGGVEPCHGARVAVDEGQATTKVLLFVGTPPEGQGVACSSIAVEREVVVTLDRPLGSRDVLWR
jgi:hypothetical protein